MRLAELAGCAALTLLAAACADDSAAELCDEQTPLVSWETFGKGFVTSYCQGCHAASALNRQGAPDNVVFDTEEQTVKWSDRILATAADPETPTMPPNGGPSQADRERLTVWLTCFAQ